MALERDITRIIIGYDIRAFGNETPFLGSKELIASYLGEGG